MIHCIMLDASWTALLETTVSASYKASSIRKWTLTCKRLLGCSDQCFFSNIELYLLPSSRHLFTKQHEPNLLNVSAEHNGPLCRIRKQYFTAHFKHLYRRRRADRSEMRQQLCQYNYCSKGVVFVSHLFIRFGERWNERSWIDCTGDCHIHFTLLDSFLLPI